MGIFCASSDLYPDLKKKPATPKSFSSRPVVTTLSPFALVAFDEEEHSFSPGLFQYWMGNFSKPDITLLDR